MAALTGKVALVTGGASGIGRATAAAFAEGGAQVVIADRVSEAGDVVSEIERSGGSVRFISTDVTKAADVERMVQFAVDAFGRLDIAFNNAGIPCPRQSILDTSEEIMRTVIDVNVIGVWLCLKYEIAQMLKQGGTAAIVNTASIGGLIGTPDMSPYISSKHAVIGMTRSLALEYARKGIRINAVCPGYTLTPMVEQSMREATVAHALADTQPMGRFADPREIAAAVVWLCSDAASFVTGAPIPVDGAFTTR